MTDTADTPRPDTAPTDTDARLARLAAAKGMTVTAYLASLEDDPPVSVAEAVRRLLDSRSRGTAERFRTPLVLLRDGWSVQPEQVAEVRRLAEPLNLPIPSIHGLPRGIRLPRTKAMEADGTPRTAPGDHVVLLQGVGDRPLASLNGSELTTYAKWARLRGSHVQWGRNAARRTAGRKATTYDGRGAQQAFRTAVTALFTMAGKDADIDVPADDTRTHELPRAKRDQRRRRPLTDLEFQQAWDATRLHGPDPELDAILFRLHSVTAARREGALTLTLERIDTVNCVVVLHEKGDKVIRQPTPPSLIHDLLAFARSRGADRPTDRVLRYRDGRPLTYRHYDHWNKRLQATFAWADEVGFGSHCLRVQAAAAVERIAGHAVAQRFLGHTPDTVTGIYTQATEAEVASAIARLTGEPHPLAAQQDQQ